MERPPLSPANTRRSLDDAAAFLRALNEALRPLSDVQAVPQTAMRVLGEHLRADRVLYADIDEGGGSMLITQNYVRGAVSPVLGTFPLCAFGAASERLRRGEAVVLDDTKKAEWLDEQTRAAYDQFVQETAQRVRNRHVAEALGQEQELLRRLPGAPLPVYTTYQSTVRKWSTIQVGGRTYSVPSRLIGQEVEARQYAQRVEVYYRGRLVGTMPRLRGEQTHRIDYRHVIWSLVRKPGAFARYRFREDLFPSLVFRRAYDALRQSHGERADVEYLRLLRLAASTLQAQVERVLEAQLAKGGAWDYQSVRAQADPVALPVPQVAVPAPDLRPYDALLGGGCR